MLNEIKLVKTAEVEKSIIGGEEDSTCVFSYHAIYIEDDGECSDYDLFKILVIYTDEATIECNINKQSLDEEEMELLESTFREAKQKYDQWTRHAPKEGDFLTDGKEFLETQE